MSNYELELDLRNFLISKAILDEDVVKKASRNTKMVDLGVDSLEVLEMVMEIEDYYNITIVNGHTIQTFGDLLDRIQDELDWGKL